VNTHAELQAWITDKIAEFLELPSADIKGDVPLTYYGLDSVYALTVCADIEDHFDITLDPALIWDHPTIDGFSKAVFQILSE